MYHLTAYHKSGDIAYTVVVKTEQQLYQEIKDVMFDGFDVFIQQ